MHMLYNVYYTDFSSWNNISGLEATIMDVYDSCANLQGTSHVIATIFEFEL